MDLGPRPHSSANSGTRAPGAGFNYFEKKPLFSFESFSYSLELYIKQLNYKFFFRDGWCNLALDGVAGGFGEVRKGQILS